MLTVRQIFRLLVVSLIFWLLATAYIRFMPTALIDPLRGAIGFLVSVPVGWLSVRIAQAAGGLARDQLLAGVGIVGAAPMMIDGAALRWFSGVYGVDPLAVRLGAAWLLWGYGVSLLIAIVMAHRARESGLPR